jgi:prepilin-type N-terminal cleavage/methylation domain-containing protein
MKKSINNKFGFTIVELLIVIVVIAILAAISVAAYNNIQQRARNSARVSTAQSYVKLLMLHATQNGTYPAFTNGACLGSGYTASTCTNSTLTSTYPSSATEQSAFNTQLASVGSIPNYPKLNTTASGNGSESGAFVYNYGVTNETPARGTRLIYFLEGENQDCGISRVSRNTDGSMAGTGAWTVSPALGVKNTYYANGRTMCMISLLNANEF